MCKFCHNSCHYGRLTAQFESGKIREEYFLSIIQHANTLLAINSLPQKNWDVTVDDNIYQIEWRKWNLVLEINGLEKRFYSLYKNKEELEKAY